jgi:hypothetical protein
MEANKDAAERPKIPVAFENNQQLYKKIIEHDKIDRTKNHLIVKNSTDFQKSVAYCIDLMYNKQYPNVKISSVCQNMDKAVYIAELLKRKVRNLHQVNTMETLHYKEIFTPNLPSEEHYKFELDRSSTVLVIKLSRQQPSNTKQSGYQAPLESTLVDSRDPREYIKFVLDQIREPKKKELINKTRQGLEKHRRNDDEYANEYDHIDDGPLKQNADNDHYDIEDEYDVKPRPYKPYKSNNKEDQQKNFKNYNDKSAKKKDVNSSPVKGQVVGKISYWKEEEKEKEIVVEKPVPTKIADPIEVKQPEPVKIDKKHENDVSATHGVDDFGYYERPERGYRGYQNRGGYRGNNFRPYRGFNHYNNEKPHEGFNDHTYDKPQGGFRDPHYKNDFRHENNYQRNEYPNHHVHPNRGHHENHYERPYNNYNQNNYERPQRGYNNQNFERQNRDHVNNYQEHSYRGHHNNGERPPQRGYNHNFERPHKGYNGFQNYENNKHHDYEERREEQHIKEQRPIDTVTPHNKHHQNYPHNQQKAVFYAEEKKKFYEQTREYTKNSQYVAYVPNGKESEPQNNDAPVRGYQNRGSNRGYNQRGHYKSSNEAKYQTAPEEEDDEFYYKRISRPERYQNNEKDHGTSDGYRRSSKPEPKHP